MIIDENTKIIGRFHKIASPRGLNIYNPFFQELGINALYVLFYNPDPKKLIEGMRKLGLSGAITAGFEKDKKFAKVTDKRDDMSNYTGRVGFIKNTNGSITASYQGGEGMYRTIKQVSSIKGKKMVIVGAGLVSKALLFFMNKIKDLPKEVEIYNRTLVNAQELANEFKFVKKTGTLSDLKNAKGDILVNLTHLGGSELDKIFSDEIVGNFNTIVDVTFETENTNLIRLARKLKKKFSTGWGMFTYQGQVVLESILDQKIPAKTLKKHVIAGLSQGVK